MFNASYHYAHLIRRSLLCATLITMPVFLVACGSGGGSDSGDTPSVVTPPDTHPGRPALPDPGTEPPENREPDIPESDDSEAAATETRSFYFSYDESGSTASRDLTFAELAAGKKPNRSLGRPYEYLNAETFNHFDLVIEPPFNVSMGLYKAEADEIPVGRNLDGALYAMGVNLSGPTLSPSERRNVALTLLVDISGSMSLPYANNASGEIYSRLDVVKNGLYLLLKQLKEGDELSLVTFENQAQVVVDRWIYQAGDMAFFSAIAGLKTNGTTNLGTGIQEAYRTANTLYNPDKANRVIILTDANANTGEINPTIIAEHTRLNDAEGIHFSGIGIGQGFNDRFLNELTDIGKGTYSALITPYDAERIFSDNFMRFLSPAVKNVKFQLTYPSELTQFYSAAEDISTDPDEVSSVNFSYNSEQFFLELFEGDYFLDPELAITLSVTYTDANNDDQKISFSKTLAELLAA
ncbi:MAG TPA: VWA domain-containing protein, partial [Marinagarivorans sp.]